MLLQLDHLNLHLEKARSDNNMSSGNYSYNVFINCPFDGGYLELRNALIFAVFDCGFIPRCALEDDDSGKIRAEKIYNMIEDSKYGVHDLSKITLDEGSDLPRFNMPFELGIFIGAKIFGKARQKEKNCLIFEGGKFQYQKYISDIAGNDIRAHENDFEKLIKHIRNWLSTAMKDQIRLPGGKEMVKRFKRFNAELPDMCNSVSIDIDELTFNDYCQLISEWLARNKHFSS